MMFSWYSQLSKVEDNEVLIKDTIFAEIYKHKLSHLFCEHFSMVFTIFIRIYKIAQPIGPCSVEEKATLEEVFSMMLKILEING